MILNKRIKSRGGWVKYINVISLLYVSVDAIHVYDLNVFVMIIHTFNFVCMSDKTKVRLSWLDFGMNSREVQIWNKWEINPDQIWLQS